jgi:excinuclease ABC subunit A
MPAQVIKISGARQHNLKNLHVEIPREKLVVITGLSGSGKSSLAFDTLYAEGQRRYVKAFSSDRKTTWVFIKAARSRPPPTNLCNRL